LLLISPSILYYARYIRQEAFILVWMTLTVLSIWRYLEDRRPAWLIGLSAVLALHAADKATSFLAVALFMIYLAPLALWQLYRARRQARDALALIGLGGLTAFLMIGLSILFSLLSDLLAGALGLLGGGAGDAAQ
jgi:predicted membrane-bound mannosyltransferase